MKTTARWLLLLLALALAPPTPAARSADLTQSTFNVGTLTNNSDTVVLASRGTVGVSITGSFTMTITFQGTIDGTNWFNLTTTNPTNNATQTSVTTTGMYVMPCNGMQQCRVIASGASGGSATVQMYSLLGAVNGSGGGGGGGGGGNVSNNGTPVANQYAQWTDATHVQGITTIPSTALSGFITQAQGGSNTDTSVTGGAGFLDHQNTVGGPLTVGPLLYSDLLAGPANDYTGYTTVEEFTRSNFGATATGTPYGELLSVCIGTASPTVCSNTGGGTITTNTNILGAPGVMSLNSGTTATSSAGFNGVQATNPGDGVITIEWRINLPVLSDGTNTYHAQCGFAQGGLPMDIGVAGSRGIAFRYNQATDTHWYVATAKNAAPTETVTTTTVTAGATTYHRLKFILNVNGSANVFIDGVEQVNAAWNTAGSLGTGVAYGGGPFCSIASTLSTAVKVMNIDRLYYNISGLTRNP